MIQLDSPMLEVMVTSLGWTLLHFLWQGAVAGVLFGIALACTARASAKTRYHVGLLFLALLAAMPVVTFLWLMPELPTAAAATQIAATVVVGAESAAALANDPWQAVVQPYLPWTVLVWAFGVLLMTSRLLLEWRAIRQLTTLDVEPLSAEWRARVARLHDRLKITRTVRVLCSARVHVPLVVGWLRPVILVPVSAFTGLTPWQLELILMHELAHVRRHDYIVNLLQIVVETLLFYHPVVRWVSRVVREEREHCCDDLVVARSGDALSYAHALAELAGANSMELQTSVRSDGGKLLTRIKRLVIPHEPQRVSTHWSVGAMLAVFGMSISGMLQPGSQLLPEEESAALNEIVVPSAAVAIASVAPTETVDSLRRLVNVVTTPVPAPAALAKQQASASESTGSTAVATPVSSATAAEASGSAETEAPQIAVPTLEAGSAPQLPQAPEAAAEPIDASAQAASAIPVSASPPTMPSFEQDSSGAAAVAPNAPESVVRPVFGRQPEFPADARLDGVEGWVKFSYTIGRDGAVRSVKVLDAQPRNVFENAVRRAVRSWRFDPVAEGSAIEREVTQVIQFSLGPAATAESCDETGTRLCR